MTGILARNKSEQFQSEGEALIRKADNLPASLK
jgi:hypothetical protein